MVQLPRRRRTLPSASGASATSASMPSSGTCTLLPGTTSRGSSLALARAVVERDDASPVVLNAANEVAVAAFLEGRLRFVRIPELIERTLAARAPGRLRSIEDCVAVDLEARRLAAELLGRLAGGPAA